jgi:hypothetical protein
VTRGELTELIGRCRFRDWGWELHDKGDGWLLQVVFEGPDSETGKVEVQRCRKWYVSSHACRSEVVRTAWKAVVAAVEHETAESFRYDGVSIFSPHIDPDALVTVAKFQNNREGGSNGP